MTRGVRGPTSGRERGFPEKVAGRRRIMKNGFLHKVWHDIGRGEQGKTVLMEEILAGEKQDEQSLSEKNRWKVKGTTIKAKTENFNGRGGKKSEQEERGTIKNWIVRSWAAKKKKGTVYLKGNESQITF